MEINSQIEVLREALRVRAERTSIRAVAAETGLSHGAVFSLVGRGGRRLSGKTLVKLRTWYARRAAEGDFPLTAARAQFLADQLLATIPPPARSGAERELFAAITEILGRRELPAPTWLEHVCTAGEAS